MLASSSPSAALSRNTMKISKDSTKNKREAKLRRQPSSFAHDESRKAAFGRADHVNGDLILSYVEENPTIQELHCEEVLGAECLDGLHRLFVSYHSILHLHILELPRNHFSADAGESIAKLVDSQQETLSKLNLSKNPLTSAGIIPLLDPLNRELSPSRVKVLNLSETQLGSKGAAILASILRNNQSIEKLCVSNNNLGTKGVKVMAPELATNSTLRFLDISHNSIKKQGAAQLVEALMNSTKSALEIFDVSGNKLGAAGMQPFARLLATDRRITGFYAGHNGIGSDGAATLHNALKLNYTLKDLRLEANDIGDVGAAMIIVGISENEHRTSAVEQLVLSWNDINPEGAARLAAELKIDSKLRHIDLTGNNIGSRGALALADALAFNFSLQELNLTGNKIDDEGAFALAQAMAKPECNIEKFSWHDNLISAEGQVSLQRIPQFRRNQKYWLAQLTRDLSKGIVSSIHLCERNIGDDELLFLTETLEKDAPLVRSVWLSSKHLTPRSLLPSFSRAFGPRSRIVRLYLRDGVYANQIAKILSSALRLNSSLEVLSLTDSNLSAIGASSIAEGILGNSTLRRLNLDRNCIGDVGMATLGQTIEKSNISSLSLAQNFISDQSMNCKCVSHLDELHLNGNPITDDGVLALCCNFAGDSPRLKWLSLRNTKVTKEGGEAVKAFLSKSAVLDY